MIFSCNPCLSEIISQHSVRLSTILPKSSLVLGVIDGINHLRSFIHTLSSFSCNSSELSSWTGTSLAVRRLCTDNWLGPELCSKGSCLVLLEGKENLDIWKKNSQLGSLIAQKDVNKNVLANHRGGWVFLSWDHFLFSGKMNRVFCLY